jgi:hypothetical protein
LKLPHWFALQIFTEHQYPRVVSKCSCVLGSSLRVFTSIGSINPYDNPTGRDFYAHGSLQWGPWGWGEETCPRSQEGLKGRSQAVWLQHPHFYGYTVLLKPVGFLFEMSVLSFPFPSRPGLYRLVPGCCNSQLRIWLTINAPLSPSPWSPPCGLTICLKHPLHLVIHLPSKNILSLWEGDMHIWAPEITL